jgi:hypothetical protein
VSRVCQEARQEFCSKRIPRVPPNPGRTDNDKRASVPESRYAENYLVSAHNIEEIDEATSPTRTGDPQPLPFFVPDQDFSFPQNRIEKRRQLFDCGTVGL